MSTRQPLVLLPGLLCDHVLYEHQTKSLSDVAEPTVADLTGHDSIADMAAHVLTTAPPSFALAGLSMGGYVAQEIMRQAPERVQRLALLDTSARPDTPEQTKTRKGLLSLATRGRFKGVTPHILPMLIHTDRLEDDELTGPVMRMAEGVGQEAFVRQQTAIMGRIDSRPSLQEVTCPTVVICGREDVLTPPEMAAEIADGIAGAKLVIVEDCGHLSTLERPRTVSAVLRFWLQDG